MATGYFRVSGETIAVHGSRVEQLAADLSTLEWRGGGDLAERLSAHVADGEPGEDEIELDEHEQRELLAVLDRHLVASKDGLADDLLALRDALRRALREEGR